MVMALSIIYLFVFVILWSILWSNRLVKDVEKMSKSIENRRLDFLDKNIGVSSKYIVWIVAKNMLPGITGVFIWTVFWGLILHPFLIGR